MYFTKCLKTQTKYHTDLYNFPSLMLWTYCSISCCNRNSWLQPCQFSEKSIIKALLAGQWSCHIETFPQVTNSKWLLWRIFNYPRKTRKYLSYIFRKIHKCTFSRPESSVIMREFSVHYYELSKKTRTYFSKIFRRIYESAPLVPKENVWILRISSLWTQIFK